MRSQPDQPQQTGPYVPSPVPNITWEGYSTLNTNSTRPGIKDDEMWWVRGFMPVGPNYLRVLPDCGPAIFDAPAEMVSFFNFFNILSTPFLCSVMTNGRVWVTNTNTGTATPILPAGTIENPSQLYVGIGQWGEQFLILTSNQANGYWLWDGNLVYTAGSLAPGISITANGSNYSANPSVTIIGGSGGGVVLSAVVSGGEIIEIDIADPGFGYLPGDTIAVSIADVTGSGATATATLMPYGIRGTAVEIFSSRVWVAYGSIVNFSAPGSASDFNSSDGGGSFQSTDSFLRVGFTQLKQSNGFLYLIADSSINYISGVQTSSGPPPVTTFTNQNADPEIGTPWPSTVQVFSRNILFANAFGAHVSYGGAVTKISEALDGIYNTVPNFGGLIPSSAKAIIFGKKVWMLLLPIIDPATGQQENMLLMWDQKRWWASTQSVPLVYIQSQEINSVMTAYGTDGQSIYPLFAQPSINFTKIVQSKLWATPQGYHETKTADRLWGLAQYFSTDSPALDISIDNENGQSTQTYDLLPNAVTILNNEEDVVPVFNESGQQITGYGSGVGIVVFPPQPVGQTGALLGFTVTTDSADMALISLMLAPSLMGYRG